MRWLPWAIDGAVLTSWFFSSLLFKPFPSISPTSASFILLAVYLAAIWLTYPRGRLRLQFDHATIVAFAAGAAYVAVIYEPVLIVHSILVPIRPSTVAETLAYSALFGVFIQSFLFNLNFRSLFDRRLPGAVALPFAFYLLLLVPLSTLQIYATAQPQQILTFIIVDLFGGTVLFVILLVLYSKSKFNNLPGVLFYIATTIPNLVLLLFPANPTVELVWLFAAFGVAVVLVEFLLPTTWVERRLFPVTRAPTSPSSRRATFATLAAIGAFAVAIFLIVPAVLGTPHPFYADATASMAPQIEPGSLLVVQHVSVDSITVGEVLVFNAPWSPGLTVAHKVIAILHPSTGLEFRTRGIANAAQDPMPVPAANVYGIVALVIPWVGYLVLEFYIVLLVTAVAVGAWVAYSVMHPGRHSARRHRALF